MDNQHRKISGYRELTQEEIDLMNEIKEFGPKLETLKKKIDALNSELLDRLTSDSSADLGAEQELFEVAQAEPHRWSQIGATNIQQGLMALTRAVAKPTFF